MQIEMSFQAGVIISAGCHLVSSVTISIFLETAWWSVSDHHHTCVLLFHLSFLSFFFLSFSPLSFHKKKMFWISRFCCVSLSLKKKKSFSYALVISLNAASPRNKTVGYNDDWNLLREACGWHEGEADRDEDVTSISVGTPPPLPVQAWHGWEATRDKARYKTNYSWLKRPHS